MPPEKQIQIRKFSAAEAVKAAAEYVIGFEQTSSFMKSGQVLYDIEGDGSTFENLRTQYQSSHYATLMGELSDYAWRPATTGRTEDIDQIHESQTIADSLSAGLVDPHGFEWVSNESRLIVRQVQMAAHARWCLKEFGGTNLQELAALAGISEKTMRAATNPKSANPIRIEKQGHWTVVKSDDAYAWLERRGDFEFIGDEEWSPSRIDTLDGLIRQLTSTPDILTALPKTAERDAFALLVEGKPTPDLIQVTPEFVTALAKVVGDKDAVIALEKIYEDLMLVVAKARLETVRSK